MTLLLRKTFLLSMALAFFQSVFAGEIKDKYFNLSNELKTNGVSDEQKKITLESNLTRAIKSSLLKYYSLCDYKEAELKSSDYEKSAEDEYLYYVRYKNYSGYYLFSQSPEMFLQQPMDERILVPKTEKIVRLYDDECKNKKTSK